MCTYCTQVIIIVFSRKVSDQIRGGGAFSSNHANKGQFLVFLSTFVVQFFYLYESHIVLSVQRLWV